MPKNRNLDTLKGMETNFPKRTGHLILCWRADGKVDAFPSQTIEQHCEKLDALRRGQEYTFLEEIREVKSYRRESLV